MYQELREQSLAGLTKIGFDGYAIGGLSVGEPKEDMMRVLSGIAPKLPADRPRYLMGVGKPEDIVEGVRRGMDIFDRMMQTRNARNGQLFTSTGLMKMRNASKRHDIRLLDEASDSYTCKYPRRAY